MAKTLEKAKITATSGQAFSVQISIPEKIMVQPKERSAKKNVFVEKYDEIRSFYGTDLIKKADTKLHTA